jgi:cytochrome P450
VEAALAAEGAACDASGAADKVAATPGAHAGAASAGVFAPSHEAIQAQLPYARATACETLRLYPSVPKDVREAARDDVLPDGTRVPRGSLVAYLPYIMGRDDTLWSDAARFDPERFLADGEGAAASAWKFPAFNGSGPRQCMGQHLALTEASFVLALVYRRFSLELAPASQAGGALSHRDSLTLPQAAGVTVRVRRRGV